MDVPGEARAPGNRPKSIGKSDLPIDFDAFPGAPASPGTGMTGVTGVTGVMGVVRLTRGRYPPSDLECLSRQDSENIAHC